MTSPRFALYFAPEAGTALADFGWSWLGRRADSADLLPLPAEQAAVVAEPRLYGFHATLKAPFRLRNGRSLDELTATLEDFAGQRAAFAAPPLALSAANGFLALRPVTTSSGLQTLADDCVRDFDRFRAPLTDDDRRKRLAAPLSERHRARLEEWGYPYVFEDFHPHLTLTCRLAGQALAKWQEILHQRTSRIVAEQTLIQSLCLFQQAASGSPFRLIRRFPFLS